MNHKVWLIQYCMSHKSDKYLPSPLESLPSQSSASASSKAASHSSNSSSSLLELLDPSLSSSLRKCSTWSLDGAHLRAKNTSWKLALIYHSKWDSWAKIYCLISVQAMFLKSSTFHYSHEIQNFRTRQIQFRHIKWMI